MPVNPDKLTELMAPIDMILFCPACGKQHIDDAEHVLVWTGGSHPEPSHDEVVWDNPPHRSHLCHGCGCIWRPADVATNGVAAIKTKGSADTFAGTPGLLALQAEADRMRGRVSDLELALGLALDWLIQHEPTDSRALSSEFVAMAAINAGLTGRLDECRDIIRKALEGGAAS